MNRYFKLVNFELGRFVKLYLILMGVTIISQLIGVITTSKEYLNTANQLIREDGMSLARFLEQNEELSLSQVGASLWFVAPIAISIVTLMIYVFFIWYRDWFAKNTFIYRLLMLPTSRLTIYMAKATTIFLMVLGLVALQIVLIPVENLVLQWMVPLDLRMDLSLSEIVNYVDVLTILIPSTLSQFLKSYLIGFAAVFSLFTIILMERSWKWKGIVSGIVYGGFAFLILIFPTILQLKVLFNYFYPIEMYFLQIGAAMLVSIGSIWLGNYLLKHKITV